MPRDGFPAGVAEQLKWYVYRLIEPRNGGTFYVDRARTYNLVLANLRSLVVGAYRPTGWLIATRENFPELETNDRPDRWGFEGKRADSVDWSYYVGKRVPERYRRQGAANPVRYCDP